MTSHVNRRSNSMNSVSDALVQGALPDAPLSMPLQTLERQRKATSRFDWFGFIGRKIANG